MDTLYAFLDGLVVLASDSSPIITGRPSLDSIPSIGPNSLDLLDFTNGVRIYGSFVVLVAQTVHRTPES